MPHIIVEHTSSIAQSVNMNELNKNLHSCLAAQETVSLQSIKTRSIQAENVFVGDGTINDFIHITVLLLQGRSEELKATMTENLFQEAQKSLKGLECLLSVNIDDLGVYKK